MNEPVDVASRFVEAIRMSDESAVWSLFSEQAKRRIIDVGEQQGMPPDVAGRLRAGTAGAEESSRFRVDVLQGIYRDLEGCSIRRLDVEPLGNSAGQARVALVEPLDVPLPVAGGGLPAAWLTLSLSGDAWLIDDIDVPGRR